MSLWISNHGKHDKKIRILCDGLVIAKGSLKGRVGIFQMKVELVYEIV